MHLTHSYISYSPLLRTDRGEETRRGFLAALGESCPHEQLYPDVDYDALNGILSKAMIRNKASGIADTHPGSPELSNPTGRLAYAIHRHKVQDSDGVQYWNKVKTYLLCGTVSAGCMGDTAAQYQSQFMRACSRFRTLNGLIWLLCRQGKSNHLPRLVVIDFEHKRRLLDKAHQECGHNGSIPIYVRLRDNYYWPTMYADIGSLVQHCPSCPANLPRRGPISGGKHSLVTADTRIFFVSTNPMPPGCNRSRYLIQAVDELSEWHDAVYSSNASHTAMADLIFLLICRFRCKPIIVGDYTTAFYDSVEEDLETRYGLSAIFQSSVSGCAGRWAVRFQVLIEAVCQCAGERMSQWPLYLQAVLAAIRVTTSTWTGHSPHYMAYGAPATLAFDIDDPTWPILQWQAVQDTVGLITLRAQQTARRGHIAQQVQHHERLSRAVSIKKAKQDLSFHFGDFDLGLWVLRHERQADKHKQLWRWSGPFIIHQRHQQGEHKFYVLRELDGTVMRGYVGACRLTLFVPFPNILYRTLSRELSEDRSQNSNGRKSFYYKYVRNLLGGERPQRELHKHLVPHIIDVAGGVLSYTNPNLRP